MKWISTQERMPDTDDPVLVHVCLADGSTYYEIQRWQEQHEAPVNFSSATIPVGMAWDDFEFEEISHWCKIENPMTVKPLVVTYTMYYPDLPSAYKVESPPNSEPYGLFSMNQMMKYAFDAVKINMEKRCSQSKSENG